MRFKMHNSASNYLSITDILVSNERVPCKFQADLPKMGFLDPSSAQDDLKAGASLELPFWLADALYTRRPPIVSIDLPKVYKDAYREVLKADACTVDLHKLGQYFYEFGCYVSKLDIQGDVGTTLINTFRNRFRLLLDASTADDLTKFTQKLSNGEKVRVTEAAQCEMALSEWLQVGASKMKTADMVANHRKRKRDEMEMF